MTAAGGAEERPEESFAEARGQAGGLVEDQLASSLHHQERRRRRSSCSTCVLWSYFGERDQGSISEEPIIGSAVSAGCW